MLNLLNFMPFDYVPRAKALCVNVLEPLRKWWKRPIIITSGFRNKELNKLVGGVTTSQHLTGEAVDIKPKDGDHADLKKVFEYIRRNLPYDQLIWEHKGTAMWIHVSFTTRRKNRQQCFSLR